MPTSRNQYTVQESFEADNGFEYAKVEYKGIGETGYVSRIAGPGNDITEGWYKEKKREQEDDDDTNIRVTGTLFVETRNTSHVGDATELEMEVGGVFSEDDAPSEDELENKIDETMEGVYEQVTFSSRHNTNDINVSLQETEADPDGWQNQNVTVNNVDAWDNTPEDYEIDVDQTSVTDDRWNT